MGTKRPIFKKYGHQYYDGNYQVITSVLTWSDERQRFEFTASFKQNQLIIKPRKKGFTWSYGLRKWVTHNKKTARKLIEYADDKALEALAKPKAWKHVKERENVND
jgi:hypothetical protein